jgi:hypothetical protein
MKYLASCVLLVLIAALASCAKDKETGGYKGFAERYSQAQHDYCSTNLFIAERGMMDFQQWLSNPKNTSEPLLNRNEVLFHINGRLFLLEEHLGNTRLADAYFEESVQAYDRYLHYLQGLHGIQAPQNQLEPITSKEQLRDRLARQDKGLDVGWMKESNGISK